jgi:hypothetical protein
MPILCRNENVLMKYKTIIYKNAEKIKKGF